MNSLVILGFTVICTLAGWAYFGRWQMSRPPIGVMNLYDLVATMVLIVLVPLVYIMLPDWAALALLMLGIFGIFYHVFEPILHRQSVLWLVAMLLAGGNVVLGQVSGTLTLSYILVNNLTLVVVVLGIANLWAQSGMKARDAAMLAVLLGIYDVVFTSHLSVMGDLFDHLDDLPLAPLIAWGSMEDMQAIGVGDLLMATLFPLVMRKSYGQTAGILAQGLAIITIALISILAPAETLFPVMIILGPIMAVQYVFWRWQRGVERTTRQYRVDESAPC
jgi:hypothetical protein